MDKEELRKEFYTVMEYSEPFGNEYHDELFNWMWSKIEQNSHKHSVSGKRPMLTEIQIVQAMAAVDEARQKLEALLAACDSGAVDKTVSDGNALQKFLKEEKEIEKRDGKIFDE